MIADFDSKLKLTFEIKFKKLFIQRKKQYKNRMCGKNSQSQTTKMKEVLYIDKLFLLHIREIQRQTYLSDLLVECRRLSEIKLIDPSSPENSNSTDDIESITLSCAAASKKVCFAMLST